MKNISLILASALSIAFNSILPVSANILTPTSESSKRLNLTLASGGMCEGVGVCEKDSCQSYDNIYLRVETRKSNVYVCGDSLQPFGIVLYRVFSRNKKENSAITDRGRPLSLEKYSPDRYLASDKQTGYTYNLTSQYLTILKNGKIIEKQKVEIWKSKKSYSATLAKGDRLPKIGFIKDTHIGVGCGYYINRDPKKYQNLVFERSTAYENKPVMNFDGKDIVLEVVSDKKLYREIYKYRDIKVTLLTSIDKSVKEYIVGAHLKGTMEISNGKQSKTIEIRGSCGD
jgi:hypothetical protein